MNAAPAAVVATAIMASAIAAQLAPELPSAVRPALPVAAGAGARAVARLFTVSVPLPEGGTVNVVAAVAPLGAVKLIVPPGTAQVAGSDSVEVPADESV